MKCKKMSCVDHLKRSTCDDRCGDGGREQRRGREDGTFHGQRLREVKALSEDLLVEGALDGDRLSPTETMNGHRRGEEEVLGSTSSRNTPAGFT